MPCTARAGAAIGLCRACTAVDVDSNVSSRGLLSRSLNCSLHVSLIQCAAGIASHLNLKVLPQNASNMNCFVSIISAGAACSDGCAVSCVWLCH